MTTTVKNEQIPRCVWIGLAGAAVAVIGAFLPWVSVASAFGSLGVNGIEGDGKITAGLAAVGGALLWSGWAKRKLGSVIATIVVAAIAGAVTLYDWTKMSGKVRDLNDSSDFVRASIGLGFYVTGVGIVALLASASETRKAMRTDRAATEVDAA